MAETRIDSPADFGKAIRARRKSLGYTQSQLADACDCSPQFISAVENGKETAELGKVLNLVNTLGMNTFVKNRGE